MKTKTYKHVLTDLLRLLNDFAQAPKCQQDNIIHEIKKIRKLNLKS